MRIEVILPKGKMFDLVRFMSAKRRGTQSTASEAKRLFESTVSTWDEQPRFFIDETDESFVVGTDDELYALVNDGARRHIIVPIRRKRLVFPVGYNPKTSPGSLTSTYGGKFGDQIKATAVAHPGFKARKFDQAVLKRTEQSFFSKMISSITEGNS